MEKNKIAFCGYDCTKCPVYKATERKDLELLKQIIVTPGESNVNQAIENLGCFGCSNKESVNHLCGKCPIRLCALEKKLINCGFCNEFPCSKLNYISEQTMEYLKQIKESNR